MFLKEYIVCVMFMCSGWMENIEVLFMDIMCGLGIIVIEVVYIVCNIVLGMKW